MNSNSNNLLNNNPSKNDNSVGNLNRSNSTEEFKKNNHANSSGDSSSSADSKKEREKEQVRDVSKNIAKMAGQKYLEAHGVPPELAKMATNKIAKNKLVNKALNRGADKNVGNNLIKRKAAIKAGKMLGMLPKENKSNNDSESVDEDENDITDNSVNLSSKFSLSDLPSLKIKLIIIGIVAAVVIVFVLILAVFIELKIIDPSEISGGGGLTGSYGNSSSYWWPIGSEETTTVNGKLYAAGSPATSYISSVYGYRTHPINGVYKFHNGIDIAGCGGKYVIASKAGTIVDVVKSCVTGNGKCGGGFGNRIYIKHEDGTITRYAHLLEDSVTVSKGETVGQGQVIAKVGTTGSSTGNHLHFEIRINGSTVNPTTYVSNSAEGARPGYHEIQSSSGGSAVTGKDNKQTICLSFKEFGYDDNAVTAILVNTYHESRFNPEADNGVINGVSYHCVGFIQWCPQPYSNRKDKLLAAYGSEWVKPENQIEFWNGELNSTSYGPFKQTKEYLMGNHTVAEKVEYYCNKFEVPGKKVCNNRKNDTTHINEYSTYVKNGCS